MASTYTNTRTETFTRSICIKNQFRMALMRIRKYSAAECEPYMEALSEQKIKSMEFCAYKNTKDGKRELWAQLTMYVDWGKHNEYLKKGDVSVKLDKKWSGTLPEIDNSIKDMEDIVNAMTLRTTFFVNFSDNISDSEEEYYMKKLGLAYSSAIAWKKSADGHSGSQTLYARKGRELQELTAELEVTESIL